MSISLSPFDIAAIAANLAETKKARDTRILNTEYVSTLADYFVITTVDSRAQMIALVDHILKALKKQNVCPIGRGVDTGGHWSLLDFGEVVVHVFQPEERDYYKLERFWNHATEIPKDAWLKEERQAS